MVFYASSRRYSPYEQMYLLNQQLICNADQLKHAVITVGGRAVQYWISYYHAQYGDRLPDERLTTSVDCDYSARKDDIAAIAKTLNVKTWENKDGQPPIPCAVYAYRSGHTRYQTG